jgi:hypothetical protein
MENQTQTTKQIKQKLYYEMTIEEVKQNDITLQVGESIRFSDLPKQIKQALTLEVCKSIRRIYKYWCNTEKDQYYIDLSSRALQFTDIQRLGTYNPSRMNDTFCIANNQIIFTINKR